MREDPFQAPADIEVGGSWRAASACWRARAPSHTETLGDVDSEELQEQTGLPDSPREGRTYRDIRRIWRFSAWLRG